MQKNENKPVKKEPKTTYNVKQKDIEKFQEYLKKQNKK
jgi:hypothetical protein